MADLDSSNVELQDMWTLGGRGGRRVVSKRVLISGSDADPSSDEVPVSAFGLTKGVDVSVARDDSNEAAMLLTLSLDGRFIYVFSWDGDGLTTVADLTSIDLVFTITGFE